MIKLILPAKCREKSKEIGAHRHRNSTQAASLNNFSAIANQYSQLDPVISDQEHQSSQLSLTSSIKPTQSKRKSGIQF
jgi:hypothetical protein